MDIVLDNIRKTYGDNVVFDGFSARFPEGRLRCIMGPSGGGKTTLLRLVLGLERPDGGTISGVPEKKAAVFQEDRLCPGASAVENVLLVTGRRKAGEARELLAALGLGDSLDKPARELSGGMRRRAALARAMLADAELLALDEPFKGLDEESRRTAMEILRRYLPGRTTLFVTHDREEAESFDRNILFIP